MPRASDESDRLVPADRLAGLDGQQVRAEPIELVQQVGLDDAEIPVTPTIAAIPIAIPSADSSSDPAHPEPDHAEPDRVAAPQPAARCMSVSSTARGARGPAAIARGRCVHRTDDPAVEDPDLTVRCPGDRLAVGDDHDRRPGRLSSLEQVEDLGTGDAVEAAGRLVGEDDRRPPDDRPGDRDTLPLTARELARPMGQAMAEPDAARAPRSPVAAARTGDAR